MNREPRPSDFLPPHKLARHLNGPAGRVHQSSARVDPEAYFEPLVWRMLEAREPPPRDWLLRDWLPAGTVSLLAGAGGTGKSLLTQQLLTCIATGAPFLGLRPEAPAPCVFLTAEDEHAELWRRQVAICTALGRSLGGLDGRLHVIPRVGHDNALGHPDDRGRFHDSELLVGLESYVRRHSIRLIALDNLAHLFTGNENDRGQATAFINRLARLALDAGCAVLLIGHPSKGGAQWSGSTAWEAAVRTRLYLAREIDGEGREIAGSPIRHLVRSKANRAATGERIEMVWRDGAFHLPDPLIDCEPGDDAAFLRCLDASTAAGKAVSHCFGPSYAPARFARMAEAGGRSAQALAAAMQRLIDRGEILTDQPLWKAANRHWKTGLKRAPNRAKPEEAFDASH